MQDVVAPKPKPKLEPKSSPSRRLPSTRGLGEQKDFFLENLADMLAAGIALPRALDTLKREIRSTRLKKIIIYIQGETNDGIALWRVLTQLKLFPDYVLSLMRVGEQSGTLTENLQVITLQQQKERSFQSKIRSAMAYPILVLTITVVVGVGIAWFILPRFVTIFSSLKLKLPLTTRILIAVGSLLSHYGIIIIPAGLFGLFLLVYFLFFNPKTRRVGEGLLFQISLARRVIQQLQIARLSFLLGTLLKAGVPISQSLRSVEEAITFTTYRRFMHHSTQSIENGDTFAKAFASYRGIDRLFPPTVQEIISTGEQTGHLPQAFLTISAAYDEKTDSSTKVLATTLEPILLVLVWLGVVFVAVSVILPIYSLIGGLSPSTNSSGVSSQTTTQATPLATVSSPLEPTEMGSLNDIDQQPTPEPMVLEQ
jgi:type IV pilus assembly protein PilC